MVDIRIASELQSSKMRDFDWCKNKRDRQQKSGKRDEGKGTLNVFIASASTTRQTITIL
jgi:hypothetical protein